MDKPAAAFSAPISTTDRKGVDSPVLNVSPRRHYPSAVRAWLLAGLVLIFVQVVVGGITRLTGSGLSITKWEIVTGTLPPLNAADWDEAFELYQVTPQYTKMNEGMSLGDFKFIYFWEYFHRLWARMMGFVFVLPLIYFVAKGWIDRRLGKRLAIVFGAAALTASFGWIMVASGLIERPLVNAYKLSMHLGVAFITFGILLWTVLWAFDVRLSAKPALGIRRLVYGLSAVLVVQILLGGMMSGMKAALAYPTWPDLNGAFIPGVLLDASSWDLDHVIHYDSDPFMSALVQLLHRTAGYVVAGLVGLLLWRGLRSSALERVGSIAVAGLGRLSAKPASGGTLPQNGGDAGDSRFGPLDSTSLHFGRDRQGRLPSASRTQVIQVQTQNPRWRTALYVTAGLTLVQILLGIGTVVLSDVRIPVSWGVLHQAGALLLLSAVLYDLWLVRAEPVA